MKYLFLLIFVIGCNKSVFEDKAPSFDSSSLESGNPNGGETITIHGSNFSNLVKLYLGNEECVIQSMSKSELTCLTPQLTTYPTSNDIFFKNGSVNSSTGLQFTPEILLGQVDYSSNLINRTNTSVGGYNTARRPYGMDNDGTRLAISDNDNNRILLWKKIPTSFGQPADIVLGQADETGTLCNRGGARGPGTLCIPRDVKIYGDKVIVTDGNNYRVLIWNTFPTADGALPDVVLGQDDFTSLNGSVSEKYIHSPTSVDVDSTGRLYVASVNTHRILIYNSIPTTNNQAADFVVGQSNFTSAGSVLSQTGLRNPRGIKVLPGDRLAVADLQNNRVMIWNEAITSNNEPADIVLGQTIFTTNVANNGGISASTLYYPVDVVSSGDDLWVADYGNNRVLYWDHFPTYNGEPATHVFGQDNFTGFLPNKGAGITTKDSLYEPLGLTLINGNALVTDGLNHREKLLIKPGNE